MSKRSSHHAHPVNTDAVKFQGILLGRGQVNLGTALEIKGDTQYLQEMTENFETLMQKRMEQAEAKARAIVQEAEAEAATHREILVQQAEQEAQAIVAGAHAEKDVIREQATQEGFDAGYAKGYADATEHGEAETVRLMTEAQALIESTYQAEKVVLHRFQKDASELIRYVTRRILHREINDTPETLVTMLQEAVESLYITGKIRLVANKETIHHLQQFSGKTEQALAAMTRFELVGDDKLGPDEIYLISTEGTFSVGVDAQLNRLLDVVDGQLPLEAPPERALEEMADVEEAPVVAESEPQYVSIEELAFETADWEAHEVDDPAEELLPETPNYPNYLENLPDLEAE